MRLAITSIVALLAIFVFGSSGAPQGTPALFCALLGACLVEVMAVRMPHYGTVSFGWVVYAPLLALPQFGPSAALTVAIIALTLRELLTFTTLTRALDEALLDLGPLSLACLIPQRLLSPRDPQALLWIALGLVFITSRHLLIGGLKSALEPKDAEMVQRIQQATSDVRWGVLGLSLVAIPLVENVPAATLALLPALYSFRKAAIHAYAYLDREDKKTLRRSLAGAETQITDLHHSLKSAASERDLLFDLSKETVGCSSLLELAAIIDRKARSLRLGRQVGLLLRVKKQWRLLQVDDGRPSSQAVDPVELSSGFLDCWKNARHLSLSESGQTRYFQLLPGVGVLSLETSRAKNAEELQVLSLFSSQVSLACLSAHRLEDLQGTLQQIASLNTQLKGHNQSLMTLTRHLQRLSAANSLPEACSYLPEICRLLLGDDLKSIVIENPQVTVYQWSSELHDTREEERHALGLGQDHRLIIFCWKTDNDTPGEREIARVGIQCLREILGQLLLTRSLGLALEQLKTSETKLIESAKLAAVGQLSAGLAHEINNPLGSIRLGIELTMRKEQLSPLSVDLLGKALKAVDRAQTIIGSLLTYSRSEDKGRMRVSAWDILFDTCSFLKGSLSLQGVSLEVPERGEVADLRANPGEIQQILTNLLLNAKDAAVEHPPSRVVIRTGVTSEREFQIEVHDTGEGISPAVRDKIFDPFFTTKPIGKGTGLGLSVSREMAHAQGGSLIAEASSLLSGACFRLTLPLLGESQNVKEAPPHDGGGA